TQTKTLCEYQIVGRVNKSQSRQSRRENYNQSLKTSTTHSKSPKNINNIVNEQSIHPQIKFIYTQKRTHLPSANKLEVWTDGSSKESKAGYGALVENDQEKAWKLQSFPIYSTTN